MEDEQPVHPPPPSEDLIVTVRLAGEGRKQAAADLLPLVYDELRKVASARLVNSARQQTLQPTALVHEAYIRLVGAGDPGWNGKRHFFGAAARAMRNILVDRARHKAAAKRGGSNIRVELEELETPSDLELDGLDVVALDAALTEFEKAHPEPAQVVMLRFFAGLSESETALIMGLSVNTIARRWKFAKAWLRRRLVPALHEPVTSHGHKSQR